MDCYLFVFVILHYNLFDTTKQCIESIFNTINSIDYKIVVVDNNSPDNSGIKLIQEYKDNPNVNVLLNDSNLGFAKGNNIGIEFARNVLKADYICCLNNDTLMIDENFIHEAVLEYSESKAAVIAPQVILANGKIQRIDRNLKSLEDYRNELSNIYSENITKENYFKTCLKRLKIFNFLYDKYKVLKYEKRTYNVLLHGCCLIFTPIFFEKLTGFNSKTFMFREEELLFLSLKRNCLDSVYCPIMRIKHLEDQSTNSVCTTSQEKRKFMIENQVASLKILIVEMERDLNFLSE